MPVQLPQTWLVVPGDMLEARGLLLSLSCGFFVGLAALDPGERTHFKMGAISTASLCVRRSVHVLVLEGCLLKDEQIWLVWAAMGTSSPP